MQETVYTSLTFCLKLCWLEGCCYHGTKTGNLKLNVEVQMATAAIGCIHAMTRAVHTHEQGSIEQASLCSNRNQCVPLLLLSTAVVDLAQAPDSNVADMKRVFLAQAPWPVIWLHSPFAVRTMYANKYKVTAKTTSLCTTGTCQKRCTC